MRYCAALALFVATVLLAACMQDTRGVALLPAPGGDVDQGALAIAEYGCGACHVIPGIPGANGVAGPPLTDFARRRYIAGNLPNTPENVIAWLQDPQAIEPGTAMPNLDVSELRARHMAAYLATLR